MPSTSSLVNRSSGCCAWTRDLLSEFPTAVRDLAAVEHIAAVLPCGARFEDLTFDALARHALARRFAQERDRAGMSAIGVAPFGNRARGPAVDLRVGRAQDDGAIRRGHREPALSSYRCPPRSRRVENIGMPQGRALTSIKAREPPACSGKMDRLKAAQLSAELLLTEPQRASRG